ITKHTFISWMMVHQKLQVKDRLMALGLSNCNKCCLCNIEIETHMHLFAECSVSNLILESIKGWLGITESTSNIWDLAMEIKDSNMWSEFQKRVCLAAMNAVVYFVWRYRNRAWVEGNLPHYHLISKQIKGEIKIRIGGLLKNSNAAADFRWF